MEELSKNYDSEALEPRILDKWLTGGYYARRPGVGDCTVTIPPPNVTGVLHMGHAMDDTIQDTIIRFNRKARRAGHFPSRARSREVHRRLLGLDA